MTIAEPSFPGWRRPRADTAHDSWCVFCRARVWLVRQSRAAREGRRGWDIRGYCTPDAKRGSRGETRGRRRFKQLGCSNDSPGGVIPDVDLTVEKCTIRTRERLLGPKQRIIVALQGTSTVSLNGALQETQEKRNSP